MGESSLSLKSSSSLLSPRFSLKSSVSSSSSSSAKRRANKQERSFFLYSFIHSFIHLPKILAFIWSIKVGGSSYSHRLNSDVRRFRTFAGLKAAIMRRLKMKNEGKGEQIRDGDCYLHMRILISCSFPSARGPLLLCFSEAPFNTLSNDMHHDTILF